MIHLPDLIDYLNSQLPFIEDYCPNGLQVEGALSIHHLVTGVSVNEALVQRAIQLKAQAILVHHGFFWKGENPTLTGIKYRRIKDLIKNDISLIAYHLPLDIHPVYGNNIQFANLLDIEVLGTFPSKAKSPLGLFGKLLQPVSVESFYHQLHQKLNRCPLHISSGKKTIETVAWCTGAAYDFIEDAAKEGVDAYISGEIAERTPHLAQELGIDYFAAGHHATERLGVQALGQHLAEKFDLIHEFIDIDNPV